MRLIISYVKSSILFYSALFSSLFYFHIFFFGQSLMSVHKFWWLFNNKTKGFYYRTSGWRIRRYLLPLFECLYGFRIIIIIIENTNTPFSLFLPSSTSFAPSHFDSYFYFPFIQFHLFSHLILYIHDHLKILWSPPIFDL